MYGLDRDYILAVDHCADATDDMYHADQRPSGYVRAMNNSEGEAGQSGMCRSITVVVAR